jgi:hypothetical protein
MSRKSFYLSFALLKKRIVILRRSRRISFLEPEKRDSSLRCAPFRMTVFVAFQQSIIFLCIIAIVKSGCFTVNGLFPDFQIRHVDSGYGFGTGQKTASPLSSQFLIRPFESLLYSPPSSVKLGPTLYRMKSSSVFL